MKVSFMLLSLFILIVLVLVARRLAAWRIEAATQLLTEEVERLRSRVSFLHDALYIPPRRNCCPAVQEAVNEAKVRLNLVDQVFGWEPAPELPSLMIDALKAIEQAEALATADGIEVPAEAPSDAEKGAP